MTWPTFLCGGVVCIKDYAIGLVSNIVVQSNQDHAKMNDTM
jgi:hypothetical protein